jgi:uncharacterized membrane protein YgdD (TMEM256/DUF423 family)
MNNKPLLFASLSGAIAVALGAMGAHFLKERIPPESLAAFETAVRYQMYHSFALIATVLLADKFPGKLLVRSGQLFIAGIILFCGSLYFLSLRHLMGINEEEMRWVGAITPFGGLAFIGGWLTLFIAVSRNKK